MTSRNPPIFNVRHAESSRDGDAILLELETQAHVAFIFTLTPACALELAHAIERAYQQAPPKQTA